MSEMYILNKKSLASDIADKHDLTKKEALAIVDSVFEEIKNCLANEGKVDISGFGKFEVVERKERQGINPSTKEKITIPASKTLKFKASKVLKDTIKE